VAGQHGKPDKEGGKARLLEAARQLVQEQSFDEVTIEEIIRRARLSRPAFYYHFAGGKEELRAALVERGVLPEMPAQDVRQAVLKAALHVYARSGVSAATLDDIATEAGVTKGALCWHFHSKEDLLAALIRQFSPHSFLKPVIEQIEQELQAGLTLDEETVFRRLAEAFYDAFNQQGDHTRLAILLLYTHPEVAQMLTERMIKGRRSITEYVQRRQTEGYFRQEIDPSFFVQVIATTFAMRAVARGLYKQVTASDLPREVIVEQLVSLLLYGIVRREPSGDEHE
jgi:AcrR family transcriptional regulator